MVACVPRGTSAAQHTLAVQLAAAVQRSLYLVKSADQAVMHKLLRDNSFARECCELGCLGTLCLAWWCLQDMGTHQLRADTPPCNVKPGIEHACTVSCNVVRPVGLAVQGVVVLYVKNVIGTVKAYASKKSR
jgi:hypothetical protein